jgi:hypothetical protein
MSSKPTARPAKKPVRAVAFKDGSSVAVQAAINADMMTEATPLQNTVVDDARGDNAVVVAARMRAKTAARRSTIAATIVCAGGRRVKPQQPAVDAMAGPAPEAGASVVKDLRKNASTGSRAPLVNRVTKVIERELDLIEKIVGRIGRDASARTEAEHRARTLALLVRTLSELKKAQAGDEHRSGQDDDRPRDLDELRRRLSERLAKRLAGRTAVPAGGDVARRDELPE